MPVPKAKSPQNDPGPKTASANKNTDSGNPWPGSFPVAGAIVGPPGVGKTEFAMSFPSPKVYYEPQDTGVMDLINFRQVPQPRHDPEMISSFNELVQVGHKAGKLYALGVRTLVFDGLTGFEKMCFDYHCDQYFNGNNSETGFMSYNKGPERAAQIDWARFLDSLENAMNEGLNVLLIGHTQVKTFANPDGPDYDRFTPYLTKHVWQFTHRWARMILFYNYHFSLAQKAGGKDPNTGLPVDATNPLKKAKIKDNDDVHRIIYTTFTPAWDAKNRFGLEPSIDAGTNGREAFAAFVKAFPKPKF